MIAEKKTLVIHVGNPKCGSTTLQRGLLNNHPEIYSIHHLHKDENRAKQALGYSKLIKGKGDVSPIADELAELTKLHDFVVYSSEGLASPGAKAWNLKAKRIKKILSSPSLADVDKKLIFIYRDVHSYLWSGFQHNAIHGRDGAGEGYVVWLNEKLEAAENGRASFLVGTMAKTYAGIVGRENLLVLNLADLKTDAEEYYRTLCRFIGVSVPEELVKTVAAIRTNSTSQKLQQSKHDEVRAYLEAEKKKSLPEDMQAKLDFLAKKQMKMVKRFTHNIAGSD